MTIQPEPRTDTWLAARIARLCAEHFADVPNGYPIVARFGSRARLRLGSIAASAGKSIITLNRLFQNPDVPDYVLDATIVHELVHYAHGFGSGLRRKHRAPHAGGVVERELAHRGLMELTQKAEAWREAHWETRYQEDCCDLEEAKSARTAVRNAAWDSFLATPGRRSVAELRGWMDEAGAMPGLRRGHELIQNLDWLRASRRHVAASYWFAGDRVVRIHGLMAIPEVPDYAVRFHVAYWLARLSVGRSWPGIRQAMEQAGIEEIDQAIHWQTHAWPTLRRSLAFRAVR